jgi:hypothetical protein
MKGYHIVRPLYLDTQGKIPYSPHTKKEDLIHST